MAGRRLGHGSRDSFSLLSGAALPKLAHLSCVGVPHRVRDVRLQPRGLRSQPVLLGGQLLRRLRLLLRQRCLGVGQLLPEGGHLGECALRLLLCGLRSAAPFLPLQPRPSPLARPRFIFRDCPPPGSGRPPGSGAGFGAFFSFCSVFIYCFRNFCWTCLIHYSKCNSFCVLSFIWVIFFNITNFSRQIKHLFCNI